MAMYYRSRKGDEKKRKIKLRCTLAHENQLCSLGYEGSESVPKNYTIFLTK